MGRPVVATDHGGARETVIAGETGWLVPPGDAAALAEALRVALATPPRRARAHDGARDRARAREVLQDAHVRGHARALRRAPARRRGAGVNSVWPLGPSRPRILVIKLGALGDFVQALGPMQAIRRAHPEHHIALLTTAPYRRAGAGERLFRFAVIDERPHWSDVSRWWRLRRGCAAGGSSASTTCRPRTARAGISACSVRVGGRNGRASPRAARTRTTIRGATACTRWTARPSSSARPASRPCRRRTCPGWRPIRKLRCRVALRAAGARRAPRIVRRSAGRSGVSPSWPATSLRAARARWWSAPRRERELGQQIAVRCTDARDLTGKTTMLELFALARGAAGAVGNDSGPMHMAAMAGATRWSCSPPNPIRPCARRAARALRSCVVRSCPGWRSARLPPR